jgi:hypothetical protein
MKTLAIVLIIFLVLAAFSCKNKHKKKAEKDISLIEKLSSKKAITKKIDKTEFSEAKECECLVKEILTTSPRYKQLTKGLNNAVIANGGQFYGISLEGSPNPDGNKQRDYSPTYDYTVYEMYTDRQLNIARFSFNPNNSKLYEYDEVHDQFNPIEFDKKLELQFEVLCK